MSKTREEIAADLTSKLIETKYLTTPENIAKAFDIIYKGVCSTFSS